jgi:hypothetical protein
MLQNIKLQLIEHGDALNRDQLACISQTSDLIRRIGSVAVPMNDVLNQRCSANGNSCAICVKDTVNKRNERSLSYSNKRGRPA